MRRTIEVTKILEMGNYFLANSKPEERAARQATANFMESMLHEAEVYAGYGYLASAEIDHNGWEQAWNIHRSIAEICKANEINGYANFTPRWEDYCKDDTRRQYNYHEDLL